MSYYTHGDLFHPAGAGTWTQTPSMAHAHAYGVAASLLSGDVLVIGGYDGGDSFTTARSTSTPHPAEPGAPARRFPAAGTHSRPRP